MVLTSYTHHIHFVQIDWVQNGATKKQNSITQLK